MWAMAERDFGQVSGSGGVARLAIAADVEGIWQRIADDGVTV